MSKDRGIRGCGGEALQCGDVSVAVWQCGGGGSVAVWQCGGKAVWRCGGLAVWRGKFGSVTV